MNSTARGPANMPRRYNTLMPQPASPKCKIAVVQFKVPGAKNGGTDKGPDGNRIDSIPIANGCIKAGASCDMVLYDADDHARFARKALQYDAYIVRINPGQLSQGTPDGTQARFDAMMRDMQEKGKLVWSSPDVQTKMGAKDALCKIANMACGLLHTFDYHAEAELKASFKKCCALQPRVIKQNRGSAGAGIWHVDKEYCMDFDDAVLDDSDVLVEMNDDHVEYHTFGKPLVFYVNGSRGKAGEWVLNGNQG